MTLEARLHAFFASRSLTRHGPGSTPSERVRGARRRAAFALAAALGVGSFATSGLAQAGDAPVKRYHFPELAAAAAAESGVAVSYVTPQRDSEYLSDVNHHRVAPDGDPASGRVTELHEKILLLTRVGGNPASSMRVPDPAYGVSCTAVVGHHPRDPAGQVGARHAAPRDFEDPAAQARFASLHELAGHCSFIPEAGHRGKNYLRHLQEVQADGVAAALLAAEHGHTRDVRRIADVRAVETYQFAGESGARDRSGKINSAAYMSAPAIDAVADWADSRLALNRDDPKHLANLPARQIVREATDRALLHALAPAQLTRLHRHLEAARTRAPDEPKHNFRNVPKPRDPAISPAFERIRDAHVALYGPEAVRDARRADRSAGAGRDLGG